MIHTNSKLDVTNIPSVNKGDYVVAYLGSDDKKSYICDIVRDHDKLLLLSQTYDIEKATELDLRDIHVLIQSSSSYKFSKVTKKEVDITNEVIYTLTGVNNLNNKNPLDDDLVVDKYELDSLTKNKPNKNGNCGCSKK